MIKGRKALRLALVGNPNTGKSSLFNLLTGMNQKVSNYPGITVEKRTGFCKLNKNAVAEIVDLPGTYSLSPSSLDEEVVLDSLANPANSDRPDAVIAVVDATNLKRNLYLFTQVLDLGLPTILVLTMIDQVRRRGIEIDLQSLEEKLGTKVVLVNARKGDGVDVLKQEVLKLDQSAAKTQYDPATDFPEIVKGAQEIFPGTSNFAAWLLATQPEDLKFLKTEQRDAVKQLIHKNNFDLKKQRTRETIKRYQAINELMKETVEVLPEKDRSFTGRIDRILTHKVYGLLALLGILLLIFQAIFSWAEVPMDFIDNAFSHQSRWLGEVLPPGPLTSLITEGILPGIAGVVIFVPQIAILFTFITLLEETGYMARVAFLMDKIMRPFGLSGKSVVPLVSGTACAIPAVMSSRNIENWKERIITIFVTPFMTCSARLPVYTVLIGLVIPAKTWFGLNLQGMVLMALYLLGFLAAIGSAFVLSKIVRTPKAAPFLIEMPSYKLPYYRNVLFTIWEKTKSFITNAGKIILAVSIVLWVLASNGPDKYFNNAEENALAQVDQSQYSGEELDARVENYKLEHSYMGLMGRSIEPLIQPLGYDWKVGIALISSFAAREIFVGAMATIYSVGADDEASVMERMGQEKHPETGKPFFNLAVGISLLLFYAFAMQCISTFAVVKKETNSWLWPIAQMLFMTGFAYAVSMIAYQLLK